MVGLKRYVLYNLKGLKITPGHEGILDALAIDNPLEYAVMYLEGSMPSWVDSEN